MGAARTSSEFTVAAPNDGGFVCELQKPWWQRPQQPCGLSSEAIWELGAAAADRLDREDAS